MKNILLKPRFPGLSLHSLYSDLINNPPTNFKFHVETTPNSTKLIKVGGKYQNYFYKQLFYRLGSLPYLIAQSRNNSMNFQNYDLIYASQHLLHTDKPWIVDLEYVNALMGYCDFSFFKNAIVKKLSSSSCKAILPWSDWSKDTLLNSVDSEKFKHKIHTVRYTVSSKSENLDNKDTSTIRILFLGSMNVANLLSYEFKGIYETVEAFIELQKEFDNLELVIRSIVPNTLKEKCKKFPNIKILETFLTEKQLSNLFRSSHIFPHSGFEVLNLSVLEAMSYGLPVIGTSLYSVPEAIQHMKNGLLIELPNPKLFYTKYNTPNDYSKSFLDNMRKLRPFMIKKIKESMKILIEDSSLRIRLGKEASMTIQNGKFSVKQRNEFLKEILESATK
jgi:glycosyltransferase involved in cell wall biosynthesis